MKSGDLVYLDDNYAKRFRVTRVLAAHIYVVPEFYGSNYPRGTSRKVSRSEATKSFTGKGLADGPCSLRSVHD